MFKLLDKKRKESQFYTKSFRLSGLMLAGLYPAILGKSPWPKLGKKTDLTSKFGKKMIYSEPL